MEFNAYIWDFNGDKEDDEESKKKIFEGGGFSLIFKASQRVEDLEMATKKRKETNADGREPERKEKRKLEKKQKKEKSDCGEQQTDVVGSGVVCMRAHVCVCRKISS